MEVQRMGGLKLEAEERIETTTISNLFIDRYMPRANGEYIKIYLLLLRYFQTPESELSVSSLADCLECTEKDVRRGLAYWEREGVLSLRFDGQKKLSGVRLLDLQAQIAAAAEAAVSAAGGETDGGNEAPRRPVGKPFHESGQPAPDMNKLSCDEAFSQLIGVASAYKKKPLSHDDCNILAYLYDTLGMSAELLEYLVETCVENGVTSVRNMEKIALGWHERNITTPEQARMLQTVCRPDMWKIMKAFGLNGRNPGSVEKAMMEKWLMQYGFDVNVVLEACDRTMRQIHQPSFEYADRILTAWKEGGVHTRSDIEKLEAAREARGVKEKADRGERAEKTVSRKNRFHNYQQRDTDYDTLIALHDPLLMETDEKG